MLSVFLIFTKNIVVIKTINLLNLKNKPNVELSATEHEQRRHSHNIKLFIYPFEGLYYDNISTRNRHSFYFMPISR